jgi:hypothetical protein
MVSRSGFEAGDVASCAMENAPHRMKVVTAIAVLRTAEVLRLFTTPSCIASELAEAREEPSLYMSG